MPKPLNAVCVDLARVITDSEFLAADESHYFDWLQVSDWLLLSGGVMKVELVRESLDPEADMFCRGASEFEAERNELHSGLTLQLTKFSFIWGALENLIDIISPASAPNRRGKVNAACYYLKQYSGSSEQFFSYDRFLKNLKDLIAIIPYYHSLLNEFSPKAHVSTHGTGLYVVYRIRNRFAHGAMALPLPEDDPETSPDKMLIHVSSHIVLLTMQMLISSYLRDYTFDVRPLGQEDCDETEVHEALKRLHGRSRSTSLS